MAEQQDLHDAIAKIADVLATNQARTDYEQRVDTLRTFVNDTFSKAQTQTAVVGSAGYVGLFAIWNWVRDYLLTWEVLSLASLLTASLTTFIGWQLFATTRQSRNVWKMLNLLSTPEPDFHAANDAYRRDQLETNKTLLKRIRVVFWLTVLPATAGSALLLVACVRRLLWPLHVAKLEYHHARGESSLILISGNGSCAGGNFNRLAFPK